MNNLNLTVDPKSDKPMYQQIEERIKTAMIEEKLKQNDPLLSTRQFAEELNVSPITVKRAYIDLKHDGFIYTVSGKGTFCRTDNLAQMQSARKIEVLEEYKKLTEETLKIGVARDTLENIIEKVYAESQGYQRER